MKPPRVARSAQSAAWPWAPVLWRLNASRPGAHGQGFTKEEDFSFAPFESFA